MTNEHHLEGKTKIHIERSVDPLFRGRGEENSTEF